MKKYLMDDTRGARLLWAGLSGGLAARFIWSCIPFGGEYIDPMSVAYNLVRAAFLSSVVVVLMKD